MMVIGIDFPQMFRPGRLSPVQSVAKIRISILGMMNSIPGPNMRGTLRTGILRRPTMSDFFEWVICKRCNVKIDAKDYSLEDVKTELCEYCREEAQNGTNMVE
jgi:hypothetical protein